MSSVLLSKVSHLWLVIYASTRVYTRQSWTWHRLALTPRVLGGERDQEQCDTSQAGSFSVSYTGSSSWGLRASHSVSLCLSLSLTHTHTQDTVIVMFCFLLESLNPSLTSPDLPENWKMWKVWDYGCFFYSEVKYWISYLGLENRRGLPCSPALPLQGALVQFLIRKLRFFFFFFPLHAPWYYQEKRKKGLYTFFLSSPSITWIVIPHMRLIPKDKVNNSYICMFMKLQMALWVHPIKLRR